MTEDLSSVYDDVQIREWAQNIRQIKINELRSIIRIYEEIMKTKSNKYSDPEQYKKIMQAEIDELNKKIIILETR